MERKKRVKNNYFNNEEIHAEMIKYKNAIEEAENQGEEKPPVSKEIAKAIFDVSTNLGKAPNFSRYSYLDEMILDGVENCIKYCHNYKPDEYENPHAYFTMIIWQAFVRRIKKEQKQAYIKAKYLEHSIMFDLMCEQSDENPLHITSNIVQLNNEIMNFKEPKKPKVKKVKKKKLETFMEDDMND